MGKVDDVHALHFLAHAHAVTAEDALVRVAHNSGGGIVDGVMLARVAEADAAYAELLGEALQMALTALFAGRAVAVVGREQQLKDHAAMLEQSRTVGSDRHAVAWFHGAGRVDLAALVLHDAHTARAVDGKVGIVAEGRHFDSGLANDGKHVLFAVEADALAVNDHSSFCHCAHSSLMASNGQPAMQAPHLMHLLISMVWGFFALPLIASTGQLRAHLVQPLHLSGSIT